MGEWKPIETAPKDGTLIRVKGNEGPYGVTSWEGEALWHIPTNWNKKSATWCSEGKAVLWLAGYRPTHWQPLPAPPEQEDGK